MALASRYLVMLPLLASLGAPAALAADMARGKTLFEGDCANCHTLTKAETAKRGPHLENLFSRRFGAVEGFEYRMVWTEADPAWTPEHLNNYLNVHGRFDMAGRADLIEYLKRATQPAKR